MAEAFVYDGSLESLNRVFQIYKDTAILCPVCNAELIVALDPETAGSHQVHPGIYCPVSRGHIAQMIDLGSAHSNFRERLRAKIAEADEPKEEPSDEH